MSNPLKSTIESNVKKYYGNMKHHNKKTNKKDKSYTLLV